MGKVFKNSKDTSVLTQKSEYSDGRPWTVTYRIDKGDVKGKIDILWTAKYGVPMEFDHSVFLAILAMQSKSWSQTVTFKASDVINVLWIDAGWKTYKAVHESILRLTSTTYVIENVFVRRIDVSKGLLPAINEEAWAENREPVPFELDCPTAESTTKTVDEGDGRFKKTVEKVLTTRLFDFMEGESEVTAAWDYVAGATYRIQISEPIYQNISNGKYFKHFDVKSLIDLKRAPVRRFYEIVEFQRNWRDRQTYYYDKVAAAIPLSSGYMNKKYIINYAETLKEKGYITDYDTKSYSDRIVLSFPTKQKQEENDGDRGAAGTSLMVKIVAVLNRKKKADIYDSSEIFAILSDPTANELGLWEDELVSNLLYVLSLRKPAENFSGYLRLAVKGDWASASRKAAEKKKAAEQSRLFEQAAEEGWSASVAKAKEARRAVFEKFLSGLPEGGFEKLCEEHRISKSLSVDARKGALRAELFANGTLHD